MTNPQTEARAIAQKLQDVVDGTDGWLNVDKAAGIIATALAAKDAELAAEHAALRLAADRADRAEAQLAEARKALEAIIERSFNDPLGTSKVNDMREIARRALEAQGGE